MAMRPNVLAPLMAAAMLAAPAPELHHVDAPPRHGRPRPGRGPRHRGTRRPWGSREEERRARQIARGILRPNVEAS